MASRIELHSALLVLLGENSHVYYQPPSTIQLTYPCVIYHRTSGYQLKADNIRYASIKHYIVQIISKTPDPIELEKILNAFPMSSEINYFMDNNLYHYQISLYY